jgi:hypothetical protein
MKRGREDIKGKSGRENETGKTEIEDEKRKMGREDAKGKQVGKIKGGGMEKKVKEKIENGEKGDEKGEL